MTQDTYYVFIEYRFVGGCWAESGREVWARCKCLRTLRTIIFAHVRCSARLAHIEEHTRDHCRCNTAIDEAMLAHSATASLTAWRLPSQVVR